MKPEVQQAVDEIKAAYPDVPVTAREDGEGGAHVILEKVDVGPPYRECVSWIGFRITFQYPYADTYPHYVRGDLARADGRPLGEAMSPTTFEGRPAIQISRRSKHLNPRTDTALIKLQKVLTWLVSRP
jgi:hypothetical protein